MPAPKGHTYTIGNNGGQPPIFSSEDELIDAINGYFHFIQGEGHDEADKDKEGKELTTKHWVWDRNPEPPTVTGLALHIGFASRQSLYDYSKDDKYSYIIKKAKTIVEHSYEKNLYGDKPTGSIFALKNMGWVDRTETDVTTKGDSINRPAPVATLPDGTTIEL